MNREQGGMSSRPSMDRAVAVHRDSRTISKPKPKIKIWHIVPPEIIHIDAANFRGLVQQLTGLDPARTKKRTAAKSAASPPPPPPPPPAEVSEPSSSREEAWYEGMELKYVIKEEEEEEGEGEGDQEEEERMFWMEESNGFLRALEEDQNEFLQGFGDFPLLPLIG